MTRKHLLSIVLFAVVCRASQAQQPGGLRVVADEPKHLAIAKQFVAHLDLANTDYAHGAPRVTFTTPYESHTDCSGFADALLAQSYGFDKEKFRQIFNSGRPSAVRYHDAIVQRSGFIPIEHVQDARPGDFLAVKYLSRKDNTGHVMLVASQPMRIDRPKSPLMPGTIQWKVEVIDSSESGHGPTDTRHKKGLNNKDHDGVGEGILRIYSDGSGTVTGFSWSTLASSKIKSPDEEHLVIGRLNLAANAH